VSITVNRFAERLAKIRHRYSHKTDTVKFSELSVDYKGCLLCMPGTMDQVRAAAEILPDMAEIFPNRDIRILLTSNIDPQSHELIKRFAVIKPMEYDVDKFSMPRREFIDRISRGGLALTIDLDPQPNFFNAVVGLRTGAPVRTAFDKGVGLPYYNFIVGVEAMKVAAKVSYRAMADILRNFRR